MVLPSPFQVFFCTIQTQEQKILEERGELDKAAIKKPHFFKKNGSGRSVYSSKMAFS